MSGLPIAYSGEPGAFAEDALISAFGDGPERLPVGGFREVFEAVADGRAQAGVVPIENVVNGSVRETYDLLLEFDLEIAREIVVPVRLCLAALPGQTLEDVVRVYSHIQALGQAERFLRSRRWALLTTYNTAGSGRLIAESRERGAAAVLSPRAAERFGLTVLADAIHDVQDNRTRFVVVRRLDGTEQPIANQASTSFRTTIAFGIRNEAGSLLRALEIFAARSINLSRLESRPSRTTAWEYVFWADLDAHRAEAGCTAALRELDEVATHVRTFGSYPRAD